MFSAWTFWSMLGAATAVWRALMTASSVPRSCVA
jgi:hypothetical protein